MLELWRFSVIALNHNVSGRSHFAEISYSFSILSSVGQHSMYGFYRAFSIMSRFFLTKIANVTHLRINLRTYVVPKNLLGPFLRLY